MTSKLRWTAGEPMDVMAINYVLVRPDGHVAWRGDEPPNDDVMRQVRGFR